MSFLNQRIKKRKLIEKIVQADEAVGMIKSGMSIGISGDLIPICEALERRARKAENFGIQLWTGRAFLKADEVLGKAGIIKRRIGQQTQLRKAINSKEVEYLDPSLGFFYQSIRRGDFGALDLAIVEAAGITEDGNLIPSYRVSDMPSLVEAARDVIVQLNTSYPLEIEGIHDILMPENPPKRKIISIEKVDDRVGVPFIPIDPEKIKYIVCSETPEPIQAGSSSDTVSKQISEKLVNFLRQEVQRGALPPNLLPIQIGLGTIPARILDDLNSSEFENLEFYSAILPERILNLIESGKVRAASGSSLFLTMEGENRLFQNLEFFKRHIVLRPVEIIDCPEVIMRLGILALNGAIEVDIYGHVNSSHIMAGDVISGVGGAGDFAMNSYLSVMLLPSIAHKGNISSIVPMVVHVDIPEQGVDIIITEQGLADLRGLAPAERAEKIITRCAHPSYRPLLLHYFEQAVREGGGHEPHLLRDAFSFHERFLETGTMKS